MEPPNWWAGMKYRNVQLMLYGDGLAQLSVRSPDPNLKVKSVSKLGHANYAFVDLELNKQLQPGTYELICTSGGVSKTVSFPVHARTERGRRHQGFSQRDAIYLITPDRFANGDTSNDRVDGVLDEFDPTQDRMRHGGDLRGIIDHLDYIQDLGFTAIWLNPVLENSGINSYHGYKATDLYKIDPRFGSNEEYKEFVEAAHQRGLKVIFDHVANHIGIRHPWVKNLPTKDWLNDSVEDHLSEKHYLLSLTDPHAEPQARKELKTFWFVDRMPDLNQRNPWLAKYLIQNSIWWIEFTGLDGIREDTYPYADQQFLTDWAKAIRAEYPNFNIVGEIWATKSAYIAHFQDKTVLPRDFETHLPAVMDFPLMQSFRSFLDSSGKLSDVYAVYAQDFLYTDINNLLVFTDNHDTTRAIFHAKEDADRVKLVLSILLTNRGIPQLLYGTEIGMLGGESHVELRADFPGGFPGHKRSAFENAGRTASEREMYEFVKKLLHLRKNHVALTDGKMIHYPPTWNRDVYRFFRIHEDEKILVIANGHAEDRSVDLSDLRHHIGDRQLKDLMSDEFVSLKDEKLGVEALGTRILSIAP